jgi:hypothetical protein
VTFDEGGEDGVSKCKLRKILGDIFFLFVLPEAIYGHPGQPNSKCRSLIHAIKRTRTLKSASRVHLLHHRFERNRRDILVVENDRLTPFALAFRLAPVNSPRTHRIILHTALSYQVDDTCRIRKRGHIFADLVDGEDKILGQMAG